VFVEGNDLMTQTLCSMAVIALGAIRSMYDEKHDKATFIKNIILDNILPGDIYIKSSELHFGAEVSRVVFLINHGDSTDASALDIVSNLFPDKQHDFVFSINEHDLVLVKEVKPNVELKDLMKIARSIVDTLKRAFGQIHHRHRTVAIHLRIVTSFKEAQDRHQRSAGVTHRRKAIISLKTGWGRLIYQLPTDRARTRVSQRGFSAKGHQRPGSETLSPSRSSLRTF
jgi:carbohydrate diacid regulator